MSLPATATYTRDIHIQDHARVQIGDQLGCVTINSKVAPLLDYTGFYANNALCPVSTYVDRADLRLKLEKQLQSETIDANQRVRTVVVHGIGGAGKTQLVLDYVQRHRSDYSAIFWVEAGSRESIERDYTQIYILLYNQHLEAAHGAVRMGNVLPAVKRWFYGKSRRWLFVLDSADTISNPDDPSYVDLRRFLPDDPSVQVVVTTRDRSAQEMSELPAVEVEEMTQEEAITLFRKQARMPSTMTTQQEQHVSAVVQELEHFALAVTLAGSYVAATPRLQNDLSTYLCEYRERQSELLAQRPLWIVHQYGESVLTTWETTFRAVEAQSPGACHFLALLSFLNSDDIPVDLPTSSFDNEEPIWQARLLPNKHITQYDIEDFFRMLANFSLIKYRGDQNSYTMHNLVQTWAYDRLTPQQQRHYGYRCALLLRAMAKATQNNSPFARSRVIPHILSAFNKISLCCQSATTDSEATVNVLTDLALFLKSCGDFRGAVVIKRFIYQQLQLWYGDDHPRTLLSLHYLASGLNSIGELQEALQIIRLVLDTRRRILGEEHPDTLTSMNGLLCSLQNTGESQEALQMSRLVLEKRRCVLGELHPDTLSSMSSMAAILGPMGELQESLELHQATLEKQKQILGEDHPETLRTMATTAITLSDLGGLQEALEIKRTVLQKRKKILGDSHPDTLRTMGNMAVTLSDLEELQEALEIERTVLQKRKKILGDDHPKTLRTMATTAITLSRLGELQEATEIIREAVRKMTRVHGANHEDITLLFRKNLQLLEESNQQVDVV